MWARKKSEIYSSNVYGTENVALKVLELNKKLIYTSSVATLSLKKDQLSDETFDPNLKEIHRLQKSKFLAELVVKKLVKKKLKAIIVNPSTPIGPGDIKPTPTGKIIRHAKKKSQRMLKLD